MRTLLELIGIGGKGLLTVGGSLLIWGIAREGRRAHAVDASSVGPVGSSDGLDAAGGTRVWGSAGSAVRGGLRAVSGGRHRAGGHRWSVRAMFRRGERRVKDMGVSATLLTWRLRREALVMRRDLLAVPTLSTMEWALCMGVAE